MDAKTEDVRAHVLSKVAILGIHPKKPSWQPSTCFCRVFWLGSTVDGSGIRRSPVDIVNIPL